MKRIGIVTGAVVSLITILFFLFTRSIDHTPYFETDYYKLSQVQTDSLKKSAKTANELLMAGFAKVSITPQLNQPEENFAEGKFMQVPLAGYGGRKGAPATGIHDSIFVKAAALKVSEELVVFVSADLLILPSNIIDFTMAILSDKGFGRNQLFFAATHTHSSVGAWGGGFVGKQFAGEENKNLQKWLSLKIADAVILAVEDLKPAKMGAGNFNAGQYTRNRLVGKKGTKNEDFSFLFIEQTGHKKAVMGSFSAHSTTLGEKNMEISAGYPGFWAAKMEQTSVDLALFFAGSMGSQSPVSKGKGFEKPKFIGESLADSLNIYLEKTIPNENITLRHVTLKIPLPDYRFRITTRRTLSSFLSEKLMPHPGDVYLQAVRLGKMVWITTPADFSGEYALQIKNALAVKGFHSNITGFNGNYVGYIIPGRYFYLDKYEPKTMGWFGPYMGDYIMDLIRQLTEIVATN